MTDRQIRVAVNYIVADLTARGGSFGKLDTFEELRELREHWAALISKAQMDEIRPVKCLWCSRPFPRLVKQKYYCDDNCSRHARNADEARRARERRTA